HVILTDRDPIAGREPLVRRRLINILGVLEGDVDHDDMDTDEVIARAGEYGCFVNEITLEPELFTGGLAEAMQSVIERELSLAQVTL
ncbi:ATP-dependent endonuclease, partial [Klebsiella pneumoniae]|nr:ATP-dependent endonuclease [Klebsiella pneumoniae]